MFLGGGGGIVSSFTCQPAHVSGHMQYGKHKKNLPGLYGFAFPAMARESSGISTCSVFLSGLGFLVAWSCPVLLLFSVFFLGGGVARWTLISTGLA